MKHTNNFQIALSQATQHGLPVYERKSAANEKFSVFVTWRTSKHALIHAYVNVNILACAVNL